MFSTITDPAIDKTLIPTPVTPHQGQKALQYKRVAVGAGHEIALVEIQMENGRYRGEVNDENRPHGYGEVVYTDGRFYRGDIENGTLNGRGHMTFADKSVCHGIFDNGNYPSEGRITYASKSVFTGQLRGGRPHGKGKVEYKNGKCFEGTLIDGNLARGTLTVPNKFVYVGEFNKNNQYHGEGNITHENGDHFTGTFNNGHLNGTYTFANKTIYTGELNAEGHPHGKGSMKYPNGKIFEGEFINGKRALRGTLTFTKETYLNYSFYPAGAVYEGGFDAQDRFHDKNGKVHLPDGSVIVMSFYEGNASVGEKTLPNGDIIGGEFDINFKLNDDGGLHKPDGTILYGAFENDCLKNTSVDVTPPDKKSFFRGDFNTNGKYHGEVTRTYNDKSLPYHYYTVQFKDGVHGNKGTLYFRDGTKRPCTFTNGELNLDYDGPS